MRWVLTEQVLGACMDVHSLYKPAVITDLPDELPTATPLARILRQVGCFQSNGGGRRANSSDSSTMAC